MPHKKTLFEMVIAGTITAILHMLYKWWMRKSIIRKINIDPTSTAIQNPKIVLIIGIVGTIFPLFLSIVILFSKTVGYGYLAIMMLFVLLGIYEIMSYFHEQCTVRSYGFENQNAFLGVTHVRWEDITQIKYISYLEVYKYFLCKIKNNKKTFISIKLVGLPYLAQKLIENVPQEVIDPKTKDILYQTAAGNPPEY